MSFKIKNATIDKIIYMKLNGTLLPPINTDCGIEISVDQDIYEDIIDVHTNIKRIYFKSKKISFSLKDNRYLVINVYDLAVNNPVNLYLKCLAWTDRPHKKDRISKKWTKKYGRVLRCVDINWNMYGTWEIV